MRSSAGEDFVKHRPHLSRHQAAGDFTHYGDQTLLLLRSVSECGGFDGGHFGGRGGEFFKTYTGYVDGATRQTLMNLEAGAEMARAGSASEDLAGAARIAPLVYCYQDDLDRLLKSVRQQTGFTHRTAEVVAGAEFFGRTAWYVLDGRRPVEAMTRAADETGRGDPIVGGFSRIAKRRRGLAQRHPALRPDVRDGGRLPCNRSPHREIRGSTGGGPDRKRDGGRDSAGRGLLAGLVLGAHGGPAALPERWCRP